MPDWLPFGKAALAIGKNERTLRRWRDTHAAPARLFRPGPRRQVLVNVPALSSWAIGAGHLNEEDLPTPESQAPAGALSAPAASRPPATEFTEEDRQSLLALGLTEDQVNQVLDLRSDVVKRMSNVGKARKDLAAADKQELENELKRGEVAPIAELVSLWKGQIHVVKSGFQSFPGRVAARVVGLEYDEAYAILEEELQGLLRAFAAECPVG